MFTALRRLIPLLATMVLIAACGSSAATSTDPSVTTSTPTAAAANPTVPAGAIHVSLLDFSITPKAISVAAGTFTLFVTNDGKTPHNFKIWTPRGPLGDTSKIVASTSDLTPGQSAVLVATLPAGDYTFYCGFAGHEELGMVGDFSVK